MVKGYHPSVKVSSGSYTLSTTWISTTTTALTGASVTMTSAYTVYPVGVAAETDTAATSLAVRVCVKSALI
jgi:hypothetical protein